MSRPEPRRSAQWVRVSIAPPPPEWTPAELPPDDLGKWLPCIRCRHLRIEHADRGVRCDVRADAERPGSRCDCPGFDGARPRTDPT